MAEADLQKLRAQVADNIRKIDSTLNRSWWERTRAHLHRNSNALVNVTLAGCLMVISFGRLQVWRQLEVGCFSGVLTSWQKQSTEVGHCRLSGRRPASVSRAWPYR